MHSFHRACAFPALQQSPDLETAMKGEVLGEKKCIMYNRARKSRYQAQRGRGHRTMSLGTVSQREQ